MLRFILGAAAGAAITVAEQSLTHVTNANRVITGFAIALPFLLVFAWLNYRAGKTAGAAPAAPRPAQSFGVRR